MNKKLKPMIAVLASLSKKKKVSIRDKEALLDVSSKLKALAAGMGRDNFCDTCGEWVDKNTVLVKVGNNSSRLCKPCLLKFARGKLKLPAPLKKKTKKKVNKTSRKKSPCKKDSKKNLPRTIKTAKTGDAPASEDIRRISERVKIPEKIVKRIWKAKESIIFPMDFKGTVDYVMSEGMHQIPREKIERVISEWIQRKS